MDLVKIPVSPKQQHFLKFILDILCLIRGNTPVVAGIASLFTICSLYGLQCKLFGPSVNASWGCSAWAVFLNKIMLLRYRFWFPWCQINVLILPYKSQCMLLSFHGAMQNAFNFGIKHISAFCFKTIFLPVQFPVIFFLLGLCMG